MALFSITKCPVCDGEIFKPHITCVDFFVSRQQFQVHECLRCGFRFTANAEDEENSGKYYQSEDYISHSNTSRGLVNRLYKTVRNYMLGRKSYLLKKVSGLKTGKILDVGAGTGFFANQMRKKQWDVFGTEQNAHAREFAKREFNLQIAETEELFRMGKQSFDIITLWHVLEHIHRLRENMQAFSELLKPTGRLIIAVPNHTSYDSAFYGEFWAAWDVPRHLWHFGPEQMKLFGEKYGFHLVSLHTMPFDTFYVSMLSEKYKNSEMHFLRGIFFGTFFWLKCLVKPEKCSSLVYVFRKG